MSKVWFSRQNFGHTLLILGDYTDINDEFLKKAQFAGLYVTFVFLRFCVKNNASEWHEFHLRLEEKETKTKSNLDPLSGSCLLVNRNYSIYRSLCFVKC